MLLAAALGAVGAHAADRSSASAVAAFTGLQEMPAFTPEEMAQRRKPDEDPEVAAADVALNEWKLCTLSALKRWAELGQGPGTLVDGAIGLCAETARAYRGHLMAIKQDGRIVMDYQMARTMTRAMEDAWRPRLVAAALDQQLAERQAAAAVKPGK